MQTSSPLDWSLATKRLVGKPGFVVDMGPSLAATKMTRWNHKGNGAILVDPTVCGDKPKGNVFGISIFVNEKSKKLPHCPSWVDLHAPRLGQHGNIITTFTKLVGRPPVMIPGMAPWSHAQQIAAVAKTADHAELAGGGIPLPHRLEKETGDLAVSMPAGAGTSVNLLFLNA